jgi:hypothetical protein
VALSKPAPKSSKKSPPTPFAAVVRAHFNVWDKNGDGKLTPDEIESAVIDPRYQADPAVALATLRASGLQKDASAATEPPFTLQELQRYEQALATERQPRHDYDDLFQAFKDKLQHTTRTLFADPGGPRLTAVKPGPFGDRAFMSIIGALVHMRPEKVRTMIQAGILVGNNKNYLVRFDGLPRPLLIDAPTDAEIALYNSARENGLWLTVIEKAFGKHVNRSQPGSERATSYLDVLDGRYSSDAVAILTGHAYRAVPASAPRFEQELLEAVQGRLLIYTSGRAKGKTPGIVPGGLYGVVAYDPTQRLVTLLDPLGADFTPRTPGPNGGYEQKSGVVRVPLEEFRRNFDGIGLEDPKTERRKK